MVCGEATSLVAPFTRRYLPHTRPVQDPYAPIAEFDESILRELAEDFADCFAFELISFASDS
jgi:hypothetical protein